jgi:tRNA-dihydrouridine synthase
LAPLHGVTNRPFRDAYFDRFSGFDSAVAPFIVPVRGGTANARALQDVLPRDGDRVRLVPQLLCNDPEDFTDMAAVLADAGYDEVNWNLGCPYPMVADKRRGSGLLPYPQAVDGFLDRVCSRLGIGLSVKMRLGRFDPREGEALAPVLNAYPLKKVIVHPRLGVQMYSGTVDLDGFSVLSGALRHPVGYNGDIKTEADFRKLSARFPGVAEWMIGRGALCDPFLPARIKGLPLSDMPLAELRAFHDDLYRAYRELLSGPRHVLDKMKEVWSYLGSSLPEPEKAFKKISKSKSLEAYAAAVSAAFSDGQ